MRACVQTGSHYSVIDIVYMKCTAHATKYIWLQSRHNWMTFRACNNFFLFALHNLVWLSPNLSGWHFIWFYFLFYHWKSFYFRRDTDAMQDESNIWIVNDMNTHCVLWTLKKNEIHRRKSHFSSSSFSYF